MKTDRSNLAKAIVSLLIAALITAISYPNFHLRIWGVSVNGYIASVDGDEYTVQYTTSRHELVESTREVPMTRHKRHLSVGDTVGILYAPNRVGYFVFHEVEGRPGVALNIVLIVVFVSTAWAYYRRRTVLACD